MFRDLRGVIKQEFHYIIPMFDSTLDPKWQEPTESYIKLYGNDAKLKKAFESYFMYLFRDFKSEKAPQISKLTQAHQKYFNEFNNPGQAKNLFFINTAKIFLWFEETTYSQDDIIGNKLREEAINIINHQNNFVPVKINLP